MILTLGGVKGGTGKSTLAVNLAIMAALDGRDVLLVDADDQQSATNFTALRDLEQGAAGYTCVALEDKAVRTQVQQLAPKFDDVVIDTGGRDTASLRYALTVSDVLVCPFPPRSFGAWTVEQTQDIIAEVRSVVNFDAFAVINQGDPYGTDNEDALEYLREEASELVVMDVPPIGLRKAFAHATDQGLSVAEYDGRTQSDQKARDEMQALYAALWN